MRTIDISGQRFGHLLLVERRGTKYLCRCDCGIEKEILRNNLTSGDARSCGCQRSAAASKWQRARWAKRGWNRAFNTKFSYYKRNAKLRQVSWDLPRLEFESILSKPCHYCGDSSKIGIDRINSADGYHTANIVPCCTICNQAKNDRSIQQFAAWIHRAYQHFKATDWSLG